MPMGRQNGLLPCVTAKWPDLDERHRPVSWIRRRSRSDDWRFLASIREDRVHCRNNVRRISLHAALHLRQISAVDSKFRVRAHDVASACTGLDAIPGAAASEFVSAHAKPARIKKS